MKVVWIDIETGGLEPEYPIIEIAAVVTDAGQEIDAKDWRLKFDPRECSPQALEIVGYSEARWADAVEPRVALHGLMGMCRVHASVTHKARSGRTHRIACVGGHNVMAFDVPRLRALIERHEMGWWPARWWYPLDTYQGAIWHCTRHEIEVDNYQLQTLAEHFGLRFEGDAHTALADARIAAQLGHLLLASAPSSDATPCPA